MQPYQKATEEIKKHSQIPKRAFNTALSVGTSIVGGGAIAKRVIPFLSKYIPAELMRKGLSKLDPRFGKFIEGSLDHGYNIDEVKNFMRDKFSNEKKSSNPLQEFETNYPDISQALQNQINQGQSPDAAAGILKTSSSFGKKISQIEKDLGKNFVDYVLELFGGPQQTQSQQMQQAEPQHQQAPQVQGLDPQLAQLMQGIRGSIQNLRGGNG